MLFPIDYPKVFVTPNILSLRKGYLKPKLTVSPCAFQSDGMIQSSEELNVCSFPHKVCGMTERLGWISQNLCQWSI
jgi:hypothetical protein